MSDNAQLLRRLYDAFNARDFDTALAGMHADVDWPNALEGGRLHGPDAVREYWMGQIRSIDPRVDPEHFSENAKGQIVVDVHQVVHGPRGELLADGHVRHTYTLRDGLVTRMDIEEEGR